MLLTLALASAAPVWARLKLGTGLTLREEYNDNIFLEKDREDDFITTVAPSLSAHLATGSLDLDLTYGFEFQLYSDHSEFDETDPGEAQRALLEADLFSERDFTVHVRDEFKQVVVDERRPSIEENTVVNKTNFNSFLLNPRYRYRRWPTFTATLGYEYADLSYDTDAGNDSDRHSGSLELEKRLSEKLSVSSGYTYTTYRSPTAADYRRDDLLAGFACRPLPKLTLNAQGGMAFIDRDEDGKTKERLIAATAEYSLTEEIRISLSYDETVYDSVSFGQVRGRKASASLGYRRRFPTTVALSAEEKDYLDTDRDDFSIGAGVHTTVPLRNGISIRTKPYVTWLEFKPEEDHVIRYGLEIRVQKDFKYGDMHLGYEHHASENNRILDDYRNNIVFLGATARF